MKFFKKVKKLVPLGILTYLLTSPIVVFAAKEIDEGAGSAAAGNTGLTLSTILKLIQVVGAVSVFLGVGVLGFKFALTSKNVENREKNMKGLLSVSLGAIIIGSSLMIAGFLYGIQKNMMIINNTDGTFDKKTVETITEKDDSNFFLRAVILTPVNIIEKWFYGDSDKKGAINTVLGFKSLDQLFWGDIGNSTPPFSNSAWNYLNKLYITMCSILSPLLVMMVGVTGIKMVLYSSSVSKLQKCKEDMGRWLFVVFGIALAPFFINGLFLILKGLTLSLKLSDIADYAIKGGAFNNVSTTNLQTGSIITTAIVKILYIGLNFKINLVFMVKDIMITVMYVFTPVAITLWGINDKVNAAPVWMGEIVSNAAMSFFYAFVFCIMGGIFTQMNSLGGWFYQILWMSSAMKIADTLRNTLQGLFTRASGVDEMSLGIGAVGTAGKIVGGAMSAFSASGLGGTKGSVGGTINNAMKTLSSSGLSNSVYGESGARAMSNMIKDENNLERQSTNNKQNKNKQMGNNTIGSTPSPSKQESSAGTSTIPTTTTSSPLGDDGNNTSPSPTDTTPSPLGGDGNNTSPSSADTTPSKSNNSGSTGVESNGSTRPGNTEFFKNIDNKNGARDFGNKAINQDRYNTMLMDNFNSQKTRLNPQNVAKAAQIAGNIASFMFTGGTREGAALGDAISNGVSSFANRTGQSAVMLKSINKTAEDIMKTDNLETKEEALEKLFNVKNKKDQNISMTTRSSAKLIYSASKGNNNIYRTLANNHPYKNIDNFKGWNI